MNGTSNNNISKEKAFEICQEFLEGVWKVVPFEEFQFEVVQGGLSNKLYSCALPETLVTNASHDHYKIPKKVLLRTYGPRQDSQDLLMQEVVMFTMLSERNLGPKLYGVFTNGRLEEYIPSRALDCNDLAQFAIPIAKEFAKIHSLQVPISKNPLFQAHLYDWLEYVEENAKQYPSDSSNDIISTGEYRREVKWLIDQIEKINPPVVFCHNDLQGGNILLMDPPGIDGLTVMFIDFEFGGYNYRGFDLGNHFTERCFKYHTENVPYTFEIDIEKYPSKSEQLEFIDAYLLQLQKEGAFFQNDFQLEKLKLLKEILVSRLASQLYWVAWSFKMDLVSSIHFPYLDYGYARYDVYKKQKKEFLEEEYRSNGHI